jgi:hypothetical protein
MGGRIITQFASGWFRDGTGERVSPIYGVSFIGRSLFDLSEKVALVTGEAGTGLGNFGGPSGSWDVRNAQLRALGANRESGRGTRDVGNLVAVLGS